MNKHFTTLLLLGLTSSTLLANSTFVQDRQYNCINTHSIKQGQQYKANPEEAKKRPFIFTIRKDKLITNDNVAFDFKMQRGPMSSYSNENYMLLLTPNMQVGLVPKAAQGAVQFYFDCK